MIAGSTPVGSTDVTQTEERVMTAIAVVYGPFALAFMFFVVCLVSDQAGHGN